MGLIIKKTIATLAIFLIIPLVIIAINWHWQPESLNNTSKFFFVITETASFPWAIITSFVLFILFCLLLNIKTTKKIVLIGILLAGAILTGQMIKAVIKSQTAESRPYVLWMNKQYQLSDDKFYSLAKSEKKQLIDQLLTNSNMIPTWLRQHWQNETGYSFPSGHTLFAVTWAFLAVTLLGFKRHSIVVYMLIIWALLIEISRLCLGMHSPVDLLCGVLVAWIISLICYFYAQKYHIVDN